MSTPYLAKSRTEIYQEKLESQNNNKNWIFDNYIGKPGGGAPLRDKEGNTIANLKSIADGKIYQYDPNEFSKGENTINNKINNSYFNNNGNYYNRPMSSDIYNNSNKFIDNNENMQKTAPYFNNNNNNFEDYYNNNENNKNNYLDQFKAKNNIYILPVPIYNNNLPINNNNNPILPINTLNINYPSLSNVNDNFSNNNNNNNNNLIIPQSPVQNFDQNIPRSITNSYLNYDEKTKAKIELQKETYRKELLKQIEEKKQRDLADKKKLEELEKNEEIKYKDYLKMKKDQHDKQELKKKNRMNKDNNLQSQNDFSMFSEQSFPEINNNENNNNNNVTNNNNNNSNINDNNRIVSPNLKKKNDLQNLIDFNFKNYTASLKIDIENEMKRLIDNNPERYVPFSPNILNNLDNIDIHKENQRQLQFAQDRADTRNLINYIFGKSNNLYGNINESESLYDKILNNHLPSYFATNKDNPNTKYNKLNSTSDFILTGNEKNHEPIINYVKVDDSMNYNNSTFGKNLQNENLISNSLNLSRSLENKSDFIPFNNPEINQQNSQIVYIPNPSDKAKFTDNKDFKNMYDKLDEIEELGKKKPNSLFAPQIKPNPFYNANNFPNNYVIPPGYEKYSPFNKNNYVPPVIDNNYIPEKKEDKKKRKRKKKNKDEDDQKENIVFNIGGKILDKNDLKKDGNKFIIDLPQQEQPEINPEPEKTEEEEEEEEEDDISSNVKMQINYDGKKLNKDEAEKLITEGKIPGMSIPGHEIPPKERKTKKKKTKKKPTIIYKDEYEEEEEPEAIIDYEGKKITKEEAKKLVEENKITVNDEIMDLLGIIEKPKPKEKKKKKKKVKKPKPQPNVIQTSEQFEVDKKEEKNEETEEYMDEEEEENDEQIGIGYYDQEEQD